MTSPITTPTSSIGSLSTLARPAFLDCADCRCDDYDPNNDGTATVKIKLCQLHTTNVRATPVNSRYQRAPTRRSLSLSTSPPIHPRATRYMSADRLGGAPAPTSRRHVISHRRSSSDSPQRSPTTNQRRRLDTSDSPPPRLPTIDTRTRSDIPQNALNTYKGIQKLVRDRRNPTTVRRALSTKKISERTWSRRRQIAELMILDRTKFDQVLAAVIRDGATDRLNQQTLSEECRKMLKRVEYNAKRREALAAGVLI